VTAARATDDGTTTPLLQVPPGVYLTPGMAQRATCLALAFQLCSGRGVQVHVVERIALWLWSGARES